MGCAAEYRFVCVDVYTHVYTSTRVHVCACTARAIQHATHTSDTQALLLPSASWPAPRITRRVISPHHHHHRHAHTRSVGGPDSVNTGAQVHTGARGVISIVTHVVRVHGMDVPASSGRKFSRSWSSSPWCAPCATKQKK